MTIIKLIMAYLKIRSQLRSSKRNLKVAKESKQYVERLQTPLNYTDTLHAQKTLKALQQLILGCEFVVRSTEQMIRNTQPPNFFKKKMLEVITDMEAQKKVLKETEVLLSNKL